MVRLPFWTGVDGDSQEAQNLRPGGAMATAKKETRRSAPLAPKRHQVRSAFFFVPVPLPVPERRRVQPAVRRGQGPPGCPPRLVEKYPSDKNECRRGSTAMRGTQQGSPDFGHGHGHGHGHEGGNRRRALRGYESSSVAPAETGWATRGSRTGSRRSP